MTTWVAVGLIGGGTAFASRLCSLSRLIGAGMIVAGGVVLAAPAFADEHVLAKDNSEVACTMSKSGLTRVSLKDDRFASVSKLTTGVDTDDFTVVNEPTRGDIYVSVPEAYSRPNVSFFGTTSKGYVYKFSCRLAGDDAQQHGQHGQDGQHDQLDEHEQWSRRQQPLGRPARERGERDDVVHARGQQHEEHAHEQHVVVGHEPTQPEHHRRHHQERRQQERREDRLDEHRPRAGPGHGPPDDGARGDPGGG